MASGRQFPPALIAAIINATKDGIANGLTDDQIANGMSGYAVHYGFSVTEIGDYVRAQRILLTSTPAPPAPPTPVPSPPAAPPPPSVSAPPITPQVIQVGAVPGGPVPQFPAQPAPAGPQAPQPAPVQPAQPPLGAMPPLPTTFAQLFAGAPGYQQVAAGAARMAAGQPLAPPAPPAPGGWQAIAGGAIGGAQGGVGSAIGGGIGAAAGGALGAVEGAFLGRSVEQLAKEFVGLIPRMRDFAEQVNDSNRHLMGWNANIARAFVGLQLGDIGRARGEARLTEETVVSLANSVNRMRDSLFPYQIAGANLRNETAGFGSGFVSGAADQLNWIPQLVEGIRSVISPNGDLGENLGKSFGAVLGIVIDNATTAGLSPLKNLILETFKEYGIMKILTPDIQARGAFDAFFNRVQNAPGWGPIGGMPATPVWGPGPGGLPPWL